MTPGLKKTTKWGSVRTAVKKKQFASLRNCIQTFGLYGSEEVCPSLTHFLS